MAHSSHTKSGVLIDLFNLPLLPDGRTQSTMICKIPNDFFLPDRKNTQLSKIDKVNGDINAIHDVSLELTEFKGCFS